MQVNRSEPVRDAGDIRVTVEPGFDFAGPEYRTLYEESDATAFQHPLWLDRFYRMLAPARRARKLVVTGRDPRDGGLRFVLPMIRRRLSGVRVVDTADLGVSDYAAPVVARDWNGLERGLASSVREALPPYDVLRIRPIRAETVSAWRAFFDIEPEELDFSAHAASLHAPFSSWRSAAYGKSFAKYLDRKKKRFLKSGAVELRVVRDPAETSASIAAIRALRAGRFTGDLIQQQATVDFYAEIAAAGAESGYGRTYKLTHDREPVGYVFGACHNGRFHYLLIGCDYERFGRHSPGLVMYDMMIEDWIDAGGEVFDFTIGDEAFKSDFATEPTGMHAMIAAASPLGKLALAAEGLRTRLRGFTMEGKAG